MGQNQILPRFRGWGLEQFSETKKSSPPGAHLRRAARRYETAARYVSPASSRIAEDDIARFADVVRWSSSLRKNLETEPMFSQVRVDFWRWIELWSLRCGLRRAQFGDADQIVGD